LYIVLSACTMQVKGHAGHEDLIKLILFISFTKTHDTLLSWELKRQILKCQKHLINVELLGRCLVFYTSLDQGQLLATFDILQLPLFSSSFHPRFNCIVTFWYAYFYLFLTQSQEERLDIFILFELRLSFWKFMLWAWDQF